MLQKRKPVSIDTEIKRVVSCSLKRYKNELLLSSSKARLPLFSLLIQDEIRAVELVYEEMLKQWGITHVKNSD